MGSTTNGPSRKPGAVQLLDVGALVLDVKAGVDAVGDDPSAEAIQRRGVLRLIWVGNNSVTLLGRPSSRCSPITSSKKCRPCTGRSKTWVRLTSSCHRLRRWSKSGRLIHWSEWPGQLLGPAVEEALPVVGS